MRIAFDILQALLLLALAPLMRGVIARLKALAQRRQGSSIWRPYTDLRKLFGKQELLPETASPLFRLAPVLLFAFTLAAAAFVPVLQSSALLGVAGDFILLIYLLAVGRFFLMLGAMDGGSSFGGMGGSREALVSALSEAPLLLALAAAAIEAHTPALAGIVEVSLAHGVTAVHALAFGALFMVVLAETGRLPVDNPSTHLELTMIHEAMILEYSGPALAWIEWAAALKLTLLFALLNGIFFPWGMMTVFSLPALALAAVAFLLKMALAALLVAAIESSVAKLRMYQVPDFLGVASALAILAVFFTALMR
jgi:formate hydrogenlyase subunit 4